MTIKLKRLKKRRDFLAISATKQRFIVKSCVIQYKKSDSDTPQDEVIIGFTVTKKQGNAVCRNKIKRKLKEAANVVFRQLAKTGYEYVIIGRKEAIDRDFQLIINDMKFALEKIHKQKLPPKTEHKTNVEK